MSEVETISSRRVAYCPTTILAAAAISQISSLETSSRTRQEEDHASSAPPTLRFRKDSPGTGNEGRTHKLFSNRSSTRGTWIL